MQARFRGPYPEFVIFKAVIRTVGVQGYRSLGNPVPPLTQLSVITGANGTGKSGVYRSLRLLADVAQNAVVGSLAREGGLPSTFWAGPETIARSVQHGTHAVEPPAPQAASLKLGFPAPAHTRWVVARPYYRLPLARLWVMQSIWQLSAELPPPLLHAETWSAPISLSL